MEDWFRLDKEIERLEKDKTVANACLSETKIRDYPGPIGVLFHQICSCINDLQKEINKKQNEKRSIEQQMKNRISKQKGKDIEM